jgi:hypothetical protein
LETRQANQSSSMNSAAQISKLQVLSNNFWIFFVLLYFLLLRVCCSFSCLLMSFVGTNRAIQTKDRNRR